MQEVLDPDGGFYSTQDTDSKGEEGRLYLWTPAEIRAGLLLSVIPTLLTRRPC